jgi:hypothetical protein
MQIVRTPEDSFRFQQEQAMAPYQLGQAQLGLESGQFQLGQARAMAPFQLRSAAAGAGLGELGLERGRYEFGEFQAGAGQRAAERQLGEAQARSQFGFLPQMEALRGGVAQRMAGRLGVSLPPPASSGGQSWMNSYQTPLFPRY